MFPPPDPPSLPRSALAQSVNIHFLDIVSQHKTPSEEEDEEDDEDDLPVYDNCDEDITPTTPSKKSLNPEQIRENLLKKQLSVELAAAVIKPKLAVKPRLQKGSYGSSTLAQSDIVKPQLKYTLKPVGERSDPQVKVEPDSQMLGEIKKPDNIDNVKDENQESLDAQNGNGSVKKSYIIKQEHNANGEFKSPSEEVITTTAKAGNTGRSFSTRWYFTTSGAKPACTHVHNSLFPNNIPFGLMGNF
jgi:hypothetical protein